MAPSAAGSVGKVCPLIFMLPFVLVVWFFVFFFLCVWFFFLFVWNWGNMNCWGTEQCLQNTQVCTYSGNAAFQTSVKLKHVCTHMQVCSCMHTLGSLSHLQSHVCQPKEGEYKQAEKDWRCRKMRTLLAFLSTLEIFIRLLLLPLSFNSISRHILCTISILQYYLAVLVPWFMIPLDVACLSAQAKHFQCAFFILVSFFLISFPTDLVSSITLIMCLLRYWRRSTSETISALFHGLAGVCA